MNMKPHKRLLSLFAVRGAFIDVSLEAYNENAF